MKTFSLLKRLLLAAGIVSLAFLSMPAYAQNTASVQEMQRLINAQQKQLEAQQKQLDAQKQTLQALQTQMQSLAGSAGSQQAAPIGSTQAAAPEMMTAATTQQKRGALSARDKHDLKNPTGANVQYSEPAVEMKTPGGATEISVHGFAQLQIIHDSTGLDNNEFDTFGIPVDGAPSQTKFSVNPSRLGVSSKTQLGFGRLNTLVSMDFNGELDKPDPRLREAYGELINDDLDFAVLAGQTYATMLDLKSVPETLDFAGPTGYFARRQPLLRFTKLIDHKLTIDVAVETPENVVYVDADIRTRLPDLVLAGAYDFDSDYLQHVRVAGLFRDLNAKDPVLGRDSAFGWAIVGSTKVNLPFLGAKDNFKLGVQYGMGYGGQLKSGPADALFNPATGDLTTIGVFSTYGGLQHWWTDTLRSNLVFGYVNADNPSFIDPERLKTSSYQAVDIVWNPRENITLGGEYLFGTRKNVDGNSGNNHRALFSSKVDF
jgi:hypothetical protein